MASYSGKYRVKNRDKYKGDPDNVVYRSMWERHCFVWLDNNSKIKQWSSEEVVIPYLYEVDKRYHRYFIDLAFTTTEGKKYLVEVKPAKETVPPKQPNKSKRYITESLTYVKNQNKWEAARKWAKKNGWIFQIWTEKELNNFGIMPKTSKKPLPKMPKLKVTKKKRNK